MERELPAEDFETMIRPQEGYAGLVANLIHDLLGRSDIHLSVLDSSGRCISEQGATDIICRYAKSEEFSYSVCQKCSHRGSQTARELNEPFTYRCYMDLAVTVFPLVKNGKYEGFLLLSGYCMEPEEMAALPFYRDELDLTELFPALEIHAQDRSFLPKTQVDEIIRMIETTISYIDQLSDQVVRLMGLQSKSIELLTDANIREQAERKDLMSRVSESYYINKTDFFFNCVNHISTIAAGEGAERTGKLLQQLSMQMRKAARPGIQTSLGTELEQLHDTIDLYNSLYDGRVEFRMEVGPECNPETQILQLPLASIVDVLLSELAGTTERGGVLTYQLEQRAGFLDVAMRVNICIFSPQALFRLNAEIRNTDNPAEYVLLGAMIEQHDLHGDDFSWHVSAEEGKFTEVLMHIPLEEPNT